MASPPVGLIGVSIGTTTCWPSVSLASAAISAIVRPSTVGAPPWSRPGSLEQLAHDQADAAGLVHVGRRCSGRPGCMSATIGVRSAIAPNSSMSRCEPELVGDGQEMQHAVGRAAGRRDAGDAVLERVAGDERRWPDIAPDEVHDQLAALASRIVLGRVLGRDRR